jgi:hypothetical protein
MRTDLATAKLIQEWLAENIPELAESWHLEIDDIVEKTVQVMRTTIADINSILVAQNLVAKVAIEYWNLHDVAVLSGGTPTPLSPKAEQVRYWTDSSAEVVAEAAASGYNTLLVDVMNVEHLKQLDGATSAISSGLFHFLPDAIVPKLFNELIQTEIRTFVFTHGNTNVGGRLDATVEQYEKLGVNVFLRSMKQLLPLIPEEWNVEMVIPAPEALKLLPEMKAHVDNMPRWIDVYLATRA